MASSSKPRKTHRRSRGKVVSDLGMMSGHTRSGVRVVSTRDSIVPVMYGGGDQSSCSTPTRATKARRGRVQEEPHQELKPPLRVSTQAEQMCSRIDPPIGLIHVKGKTLIRDEDAPPGFGFYPKGRSSLRRLRSGSSPQLRMITNHRIFENPLLPSVPNVYGSSVPARKAVFPKGSSKAKPSSVYADERFSSREDELLSTASFNQQSEDTDDTDNDTTSGFCGPSRILENEVDSSNVPASHKCKHGAP